MREFSDDVSLRQFHFPRSTVGYLRKQQGMPENRDVQDRFIKFLERLVDHYRHELKKEFPTTTEKRDALRDVIREATRWTRALNAIDRTTATWMAYSIATTPPDHHFERHLKEVSAIQAAAKKFYGELLKSVPSGPRKDAQEHLVWGLSGAFIKYEMPIGGGNASLFVKVLTLLLEPKRPPVKTGSDTAHHLTKNLLRSLPLSFRRRFPKSFPKTRD
jgi:hypothetical protein